MPNSARSAGLAGNALVFGKGVRSPSRVCALKRGCSIGWILCFPSSGICEKYVCGGMSHWESAHPPNGSAHPVPEVPFVGLASSGVACLMGPAGGGLLPGACRLGPGRAPRPTGVPRVTIVEPACAGSFSSTISRYANGRRARKRRQALNQYAATTWHGRVGRLICSDSTTTKGSAQECPKKT